ncbi:MAG: hypothetical protein H6983_17660 [Ectothiorhodospiraceae bacterium]|nr:hypothetical protein [Chromatiales bacterium]MCP5156003.1 hypothetical protein [Ectothiorhodospiraceae bacterium]
MSRRDDSLTDAQLAKMRAEWDDAHDFDPRDPLFGLTREELGGPKLSRRAALRLFAAAGTLTAAHLVPSFGIPNARAQSGGHLRCGWANVGEISTLDPAKMNQVLQFQITSNVLSGLMHLDAQFVPYGDIAENWTISPDGKEYVFKLREGVKFHNGDAFTAKDVVFTYNRSKNKDISFHYRVLDNVLACEALNDYEVKLVLGQPQASLLTKTLQRSFGRAMTIVSERALKEMGDAAYGLRPVGTGPFKVTFHELGQGVILERNADFWDPERPKLDKVTIKPIADAEPMAAAIEAGDVDLIGGQGGIALELLDRFEQNADLTVVTTPGAGFEAVWMNPHREPFVVSDFNKPVEELLKEKGFKVRLAIAKALDRERFLKQASFGRGAPSYGSINQAMGFFFDKKLGEESMQRDDVEAARKLLAEAGYPNGEGFPKLTISASTQNRRNLQVIANNLKRSLNIDIDVATREGTVSLEEFLSMNFDMKLLGSGGDYDPDDAVVDWMQTASKFNGRKRDPSMKFGYFSEKRADELIEAQQFEVDPAKRKAMVQEANRITSDKVAAAFLYHPVDRMVFRKNVNYPDSARVPGLVDMDQITLS